MKKISIFALAVLSVGLFYGCTQEGTLGGESYDIMNLIDSSGNLKAPVSTTAITTAALTTTGTATLGGGITLASGAKVFTGSAATGNAVYAAVGSIDAVGSIYVSSGSGLFVQVANAGAESDWYKVTISNAD